MNLPCDFQGTCTKPGIYVIPSNDPVPVSIRACADHRALWVQALRRRKTWPCAVEGCPRPGAQDGLCEPHWLVIRAHDELIVDGMRLARLQDQLEKPEKPLVAKLRDRNAIIEVTPAMRVLAVRHRVRDDAPPVPEPGEITQAPADAETLSGILRVAQKVAGRAPPEYREETQEAVSFLRDAYERATLLGKVKLTVRGAGAKKPAPGPEGPQRSLFGRAQAAPAGAPGGR